LLNNIKFVAHLFKFNLVSEQIISKIFTALLIGPEDGEQGEVSSRTVEGAIILINMIGKELDEQVA